jgi:hypothetical protein
MVDLARKIEAYGFMLEETKLEDLANNIPNVWLEFLSVIEYSLGNVA